MTALFILPACLKPPSENSGNEIILDGSSQYLFINNKIDIFLDESSELEFEDILKPEIQPLFQKNKMGKTGWGYTDAALWFRVRLNVMKGGDYLLDLDYPLLDSVTFFIPGNQGWKILQTGDRSPFSSRNYDHESFVVLLDDIPSGNTADLYIKIKSESSLFAPLYISDHASFDRHSFLLTLFHGIYYGLSLSLILYNLLIYFFLRNKNYLYYVLWIFSFSLLQAVWNGHAFHYLWPEGYRWGNYASILFMMLSIFFSGIFSIYFLNMKEYIPRLYRASRIFFILVFLYIFPAYFIPYGFSVALGNIISSVCIVVIAASAIYIYRKGFVPARLFIIAWTFMFAAVLLINLQSGVSVLSNWIMLYGYEAASAFEMMIISFALADYFKFLQLQLEQSKQDTIDYDRLTVEIIEASKERLERQIAVRTKDLEDAKKEAEKAIDLKDKFISLVSHDLKSPLLGILSLMDIFDEDPEGMQIDAATKKRLTEQLKNSTRTLLDMIDQLLNIGRLKTGKIRISPEYFGIKDAAEEAILLFSGIASEKEISLVSLIENDIKFFGDRLLIKEVIQNLISNAIKFSHSGGKIEIFIPAQKENCVAVRDDGVGMDQRLIDSIVQQRSITSIGTASERGSGLGLMFCMDILDNHGGSIDIDSRKGEGSVFTINLPEPRNVILVVDDNDEMRKSVRQILSGRVCHILEAHDGIHALEILSSITPLMVVTDVHMPEMGGFDLLKEIRRNKVIQDLPVIVMTTGSVSGFDSDSSLEEILYKIGANGFFLKPLDSRKFLEKVDELISLEKK